MDPQLLHLLFMFSSSLSDVLVSLHRGGDGRLSLQNIPNDLQSLRLIDFHLLFWRAQERLFAVLGTLTALFKTSAELRLETQPYGNN
jgi:hypothetical protein